MDRSILYALEHLGCASVTLKDEQTACVKAICDWKDVFLWLPTGFGKSMCYEVLSFVFDVKLGRRDSLVIIVSPSACIEVAFWTWKILADCCLAKQTNSRTTSYWSLTKTTRKNPCKTPIVYYNLYVCSATLSMWVCYCTSLWPLRSYIYVKIQIHVLFKS